LRTILEMIKTTDNKNPNEMLEKFMSAQEPQPVQAENTSVVEDDMHLMDDRTPGEVAKTEEDVDLYNIKNFSL
jgi:hypothetical protein